MKWLIVFGPVLELALYAIVSKFWVSDFKEIKPIIILQIVLYTFLITPLLLWGYMLKH
ncbi:hypothetical protein RAH41_06810 [Gottfriedia acidiceleris]|uniref:hypothetical protein n=1 Tax=Gottfriedia acidiceleris TaxID=371036 RepID=UPI002F26B1B4